MSNFMSNRMSPMLMSAEFAFKYASDNGRKKVTAVHKANIMKVKFILHNTYPSLKSLSTPPLQRCLQAQ